MEIKDIRIEKNLRTVKINKELHAIAKLYCYSNGIKMYKLIENLLMKEFNNEKKNNE